MTKIKNQLVQKEARKKKFEQREKERKEREEANRETPFVAEIGK